MNHHPNLADALEHMRSVARNAPTPPCDAPEILTRVLAEATRSDVSSAFISVRRHNFGVWVAVGVAASLSLFIASQTLKFEQTKTAIIPERGQMEQGGGINGGKLQVGQRVHAVDRDVTIKHGGVATWRLLTHGKAQIVENDSKRITVALEDGLIQADVIPQERPESFAIEVGSTRVAVHGTMFSVERRGDIAEVVVREGKVMVGSNRERGSMTGTLLTAPTRAKIGIRAGEKSDPEISAEPLTRPQPPRWPGVSAANSPASAVSEANTTKDRKVTSRAAELEKAWARVEAIASSCFAEHTAKNPSVRVSFKTLMSLSIGAHGRIGNLEFYPPVPEPVRACTQERVSRLSENPILEGATLSRPAVLSR